MFNDILKVGIAGFGVVGQKRKKLIDENPMMKTVAICDIRLKDDLSLISSASLSYQYKDIEKIEKELENNIVDDTKYFRDYKNMLDNCEIDVLFVCLPNYLAARVTIIGIENGYHVFCEKPPAKTVEELKEVIQCSKKYPHIKLKYGFNHRYHDSVKKARELIDSGEYGDIVSFRGVYGKSSIIPFGSGSGWRSNKQSSGGGILLDQGIHMLDLIRYFSSDYHEIYSFISNDYWKHDVEDNAFILMKNKSGQIASLHSTATQWQHRFRLEVILREGLFELTGILSGSKSYGSETLKIIQREESGSAGAQKEKTYTFLNDNSWKYEIDEFADCIVNDKPVANGTGYDALKVMEMVFSIYKADKIWWDYYNNK